MFLDAGIIYHDLWALQEAILTHFDLFFLYKAKPLI